MNSATKNNNTITAAWQNTLAARWGDPAIYSVDAGVLRTFAGIEAEAALIAENLALFTPGDTIAIQIGNKPQWPALLLACLRAGLIVLPLGTHIERPEFELAVATCHIRGRIGLCGAKIEYDLLDSAGANRAAPFAPFAPFAWPEPRPAFLKLTSGTTAAPRAIRFRESQLVADCENICDTMGFGSGDINYGVIPFSHSYGFSNLITPLLCRGVPLVCSEDRLPRAILHGLAASRATVFPGMPVFYQKLSELEGDLPALPDLRLCVSAGAPLLAAVASAFTAKFRLKIHTFYGSSECGGICYDASDTPDYEDGHVGHPMKNVAVNLENAGEPARIEVRSEAVGDGYFPGADAAILGEGCFVPGDLIEKNSRGMRIAGRVTDIINVAGRKLNPLEVEARLLEFPGVKQAIVFGIPSALRHEEAIACIAGLADPAPLMAHAHTVLSPWQVPKDIWLVDEIPSSDRGKISRRDLAKRYLARSAPPA